MAGCARCAVLEQQVAQLQQEVAGLKTVVAELRAQLKRNSSNSSKPPSSDPPGASLPPKGSSGRKPGGQPGHPGHFRTLLPAERVDHVITYTPDACRHCGANLPARATDNDPPPRRHQVIEIPPPAAVVTEHRGQARTCAHCGGVTRASIPTEVLAHVTGPRLSALLGYLSGRCHDGKRLGVEFLCDVLDVPLALGTVMARQEELARALAGPYAQIRRLVRRAPAKNVDETGWRQAGARRWLWTAAAKRAALFVITPSRGWAGLQALLGREPRKTGGGKGVVGCDRFPAYEPLGPGRTQLCWAHLQREFRKWSEPGGHSRQMMDLGEAGLEITKQVMGLWRAFKCRDIGRRTMRRRAGPLRRLLHKLLNRGSRLRQLRDRKGSRFCGKLLARRRALWTFLRRDGVEPNNNHAERCLRPAVMWRKTSFGCHSHNGCRFVERILSVVTTLRLRGKAVFAYLEQLLCAHRAGLPAPSIFD